MPDDKEMLAKIRAKLRYSENAKDAGTEGTVYVKFVIEADGSITNVKAQNEIDGTGGSELVKNAEIAVRSLGRVTPAKQNGTPVRLERTLPISFVLSD